MNKISILCFLVALCQFVFSLDNLNVIPNFTTLKSRSLVLTLNSPPGDLLNKETQYTFHLSSLNFTLDEKEGECTSTTLNEYPAKEIKSRLFDDTIRIQDNAINHKLKYALTVITELPEAPATRSAVLHVPVSALTPQNNVIAIQTSFSVDGRHQNKLLQNLPVKPHFAEDFHLQWYNLPDSESASVERTAEITITDSISPFSELTLTSHLAPVKISKVQSDKACFVKDIKNNKRRTSTVSVSSAVVIDEGSSLKLTFSPAIRVHQTLSIYCPGIVFKSTFEKNIEPVYFVAAVETSVKSGVETSMKLTKDDQIELSEDRLDVNQLLSDFLIENPTDDDENKTYMTCLLNYKAPVKEKYDETDDPDDNDSKPNNNTVWIVLGVLIVLAVMGSGGAYFLYKRRQKNANRTSEEAPYTAINETLV